MLMMVGGWISSVGALCLAAIAGLAVIGGGPGWLWAAVLAFLVQAVIANPLTGPRLGFKGKPVRSFAGQAAALIAGVLAVNAGYGPAGGARGAVDPTETYYARVIAGRLDIRNVHYFRAGDIADVGGVITMPVHNYHRNYKEPPGTSRYVETYEFDCATRQFRISERAVYDDANDANPIRHVGIAHLTDTGDAAWKLAQPQSYHEAIVAFVCAAPGDRSAQVLTMIAPDAMHADALALIGEALAEVRRIEQERRTRAQSYE